jgi:hypothetical protein
MSNNQSFPTNRQDAAPAETIEQRIERGRQTDRIYDGAIVPFPSGVTPQNVFTSLRGGERKRVNFFS